MKTLADMVREAKGDGKASGRPVELLALGWLRYEALRKLKPVDFAVLNRRNLCGENFDEMVDELVLKSVAGA